MRPLDPDAAFLLQILAMLTPGDDPMTTRELRQVSDLEMGKFGGALSQLQSRGLAAKSGKKWHVTHEGRVFHAAN